MAGLRHVCEMEALTLAELDAQSAAFDEAVLATPEIDRFCSASDWILPAAKALMPAREPWIRRGHSGWLALMRERHAAGMRVLQPLEAMWGLACPFVGPDPAKLVDEAQEELRVDAAWDALVVCGVPPGSALWAALLCTLGARYQPRAGDPTVRCVADLRRGAEAWLARRTRNFRRALSRAERDASEQGIVFARCEAHDEASALAAYERLLAVEARSWKGREGSGLETEEMRAFYRRMVPRLARRGALRLRFGQHQGRDVAYILGGIFDGVYRGLQFSFDQAYAGLSLGNLAQWEEVRALAAEGIAMYDLGTDREYKHRWADAQVITHTLIFLRRGLAG